jgi:hypothetical protein
MKIIEIPAKVYPRKAFMLDESEHADYLTFTPGIRVLPAEYTVNSGDSVKDVSDSTFSYIKFHEDGEQFWNGGGHECVDHTGVKRAFYPDALIVHPDLFKKRKKLKQTVAKSEGKRGRPKMDPILKKEIQIYVPTGGKRGRPKKTKI